MSVEHWVSVPAAVVGGLTVAAVVGLWRWGLPTAWKDWRILFLGLCFSLVGFALRPMVLPPPPPPPQSVTKWVSATNQTIPASAIQSGHEPDGRPLFVCRARFEHGLHPGKIRRDLSGCHIPWGGKERAVAQYEVLVREILRAAP